MQLRSLQLLLHVETCHVITCPLTFAPTSCIEWTAYIFIVTVFITIGMILGTASFPFLNIWQECWRTASKPEAIQVIPSRAKRLDIKSEKHNISHRRANLIEIWSVTRIGRKNVKRERSPLYIWLLIIHFFQILLHFGLKVEYFSVWPKNPHT